MATSPLFSYKNGTYPALSSLLPLAYTLALFVLKTHFLNTPHPHATYHLDCPFISKSPLHALCPVVIPSRTSNPVNFLPTLAIVPPTTCPITHHLRSSSLTRTSTIFKLFPSPAIYPSTQHSLSSSPIVLALRSGWFLILVQH